MGVACDRDIQRHNFAEFSCFEIKGKDTGIRESEAERPRVNLQ